MGGGAWPFLVGGVICLVNSDNERDLNLLNSNANSARGFRGVGGWVGGFALLLFPPFLPPGGSAAQLLRGTVGV